MDTLYGTLLHASTLIRNFIEQNVSSAPPPLFFAKLITPKICPYVARDLSDINSDRNIKIARQYRNLNNIYSYITNARVKKEPAKRFIKNYLRNVMLSPI